IDAMLSGTEAPVVIKIYGDDLDKLNRLAGQVKAIMQHVEGLEDIAIEQQIDRPEISITPRRHLLAAHGITASQFNDLVNTALAGKIVSQVFEDGYPRNLTLKISLPESNAVDELASITVDTPDGPISLSDIAEIRSTTGPNTINRDNNSRRITVSANIEGRDVSSAVNEMMDKIDAEIKLPEGYSIIEAGQAQSAAAASQRLLLASIVAILIIFALLYYEFKSLKQSLIILINMPLAMIGGIIIIWICGLSMDIPAIIGMIALLGIATRNGMLLISHYNDLIMSGITVKDAVIKGSIDRIAPIVMTALTSALALIPLALRGGDPGNEIQSPLAIVILGGLATSTLLNLYITPIIFLLTNSKNKRK
ncbi:MAG: efflux RND transporter permease subunit, partial [Muribaculaceae bacterium]|nr:efflux RND transporter permease subunit [Muribaculaceae bacterium]